VYCHLPGRTEEDSLIHGPWPGPEAVPDARIALEAFEAVQEIVGAVRNLRSDYGVDPSRTVEVIVARAPAVVAEALGSEQEGVLRLGRISKLDLADALPVGQPGAHAVLRSGAEVFLPLSGVVDLDRERERIAGEIERLNGLLAGSRARLADHRFTDRAPPDVVEKERDKCRSLEERLELLVEKREAYGAG
jgi:valyl-tRNA synthetase